MINQLFTLVVSTVDFNAASMSSFHTQSVNTASFLLNGANPSEPSPILATLLAVVSAGEDEVAAMDLLMLLVGGEVLPLSVGELPEVGVGTCDAAVRGEVGAVVAMVAVLAAVSEEAEKTTLLFMPDEESVVAELSSTVGSCAPVEGLPVLCTTVNADMLGER